MILVHFIRHFDYVSFNEGKSTLRFFTHCKVGKSSVRTLRSPRAVNIVSCLPDLKIALCLPSGEIKTTTFLRQGNKPATAIYRKLGGTWERSVLALDFLHLPCYTGVTAYSYKEIYIDIFRLN